jgi:hypothetical protein
MSLSMYIVGSLIFGTYMAFTIWNIVYSGNKQAEENEKLGEYTSKRKENHL